MFEKLLDHKHAFGIFFFLHLLLRVAIAIATNLGNDEVYYTLYARYPSVSYFDHPPAVGWLIWLSTLGTKWIFNDFMVRLGAIVVGSINVYLVYRIGAFLKDKKTGILAAVLFTSSIYASVISGTFIMPDTPLSLCWLLAVFCFLKYIDAEKNKYTWLLLFGLAVGGALLAKYQAVFLWGAAFIYLFKKEKSAFKKGQLWASLGLTLLLFLPVLWWNLNSAFSGFGYHSDRVGNKSFLPIFDYVLPEILGQILYQNPFVWLLCLMAVFHFWTLKRFDFDKKMSFMWSLTWPLIGVAVLLSLFNRTLPHWSGPAYFSLMFMVALYLRETGKRLNWLRNGILLFYAAGLAFLALACFDFIPTNKETKAENLGKNNILIDLCYWDEISEQLNQYMVKNGILPEAIITHNWFPAAHLNYYIVGEKNIPVHVLNDRNHQHEFARISGDYEGIGKAVYITTSHYFHPPNEEVKVRFPTMGKMETIPIYINNTHRLNVFLWRLK